MNGMYAITMTELRDLLLQHNLLRAVNDHGQYYYDRWDDDQIDRVMTHLSYNSLDVSEETLFFCKGASFKEAYIQQAVEAGVSCYIAEKSYDVAGAIGFIVTDIREAMAVVAREFYQRPDEQLQLVGITGTKGKTTTTFLTRSILEEAQPGQTAFISTLAISLDGKSQRPANLTTPEALDLWAMLAEARSNQMRTVLMEVSSQAFKMKRVFGLRFDVAAFLNFSPDHIGVNEHPSLEDYLYCKTELMKYADIAVINRQLDDYDFIQQVAQHYSQQVISYGVEQGDYTLDLTVGKAEDFAIESARDPLELTGHYQLGLPGDFNKENALCGAIIGRLLSTEVAAIQAGLAHASVPGRMEHTAFGKDNHIYVDFAHNYISLKRLLDFIVDHYPDHRLTVILGAPGGKGESRRADMGKVLSNYTGEVILTEDDPNFDSVEAISEQIASHIVGESMKPAFIPDRVNAIETAVERAKYSQQEVIVIAGKGSDQYMIKQGKKNPYIGDHILVKTLIQGADK